MCEIGGAKVSVQVDVEERAAAPAPRCCIHPSRLARLSQIENGPARNAGCWRASTCTLSGGLAPLHGLFGVFSELNENL